MDIVRWIQALGASIILAGTCPAQEKPEPVLPVRGLCIAAPAPARVDEFVTFIQKELAPRRVNTLILRVDYAYQYESHPELRDKDSLSKAEVKKLVAACKASGIRLIPQVNLLGHQSWASDCGKLLEVYPDFDETPWVKFPEKYQWPNPDRLYCKSYCPLHPKVHGVVFAIVDEICQVFEADAFHAGMDEAFYLGEAGCPRCGGRDKAELYADEVRRIRDHVAASKRELWIWGDRLLEGKISGLGEWEASFNNTAKAVDLIPKDVLICDWHYERAELTPYYFAMKGLRVLSCSWNQPEPAVQQVKDQIRLRQSAPSPEVRDRYQGVLHTVWNPAGAFLDAFYNKEKKPEEKKSEAACFRAVFGEIQKNGSSRNSGDTGRWAIPDSKP